MKKFLLAASLALVTLNFGVARAASPGDGVGAYVGGPTPDSSFGSFAGNTMTVGSGFYNANTWTDFENGVLDGGMTFTAWKNWENALSGSRRLVTIGYPLWDWNTSEGNTFSACASGSYDTHFTNLAHTIINSGISHVVLRLAWEFNGSWQAYDGTGTYQPAGNGIFPNGDTTNFKGCWQHFVNAVRTVDTGTPHVVLFDFNRTAGCCSGSGEDGYVDDNYYPGDAYVDYIGYDLYDTQSNASTQSQLAAIASYMRSNHPTKLVSFPEWGAWQTGTSANGQGDDPNYIQIMHDFFANPANKVGYENYFDEAGDANHDIDSSGTIFPQSAARFQQLFASPYANPVSAFPGGTAPTTGKFAHTVVVMLENHSYNDVQTAIQNGSMPWLASILNSGALMTNSYGVSHPSQPNYLMLWAGSTFGVTDDNAHAETGPTLKSEGAASSPAVTVTEWYDGILSDTQWPQHLPETSFAASPDSGSAGTAFSSFPTTSSGFAAMVPLSLVVPSYCHDAHDPTGTCTNSIATELTDADTWMQAHLGPYLTWAYNNNSALVIEFDESQTTDTACSPSGGTTCGGHVFTWFGGQGIAPGTYSDNLTTAGLHTTLAGMASITLNGSDPSIGVSPVTSIFGSSPPPPPPPPPPATGCSSSLAQDTMCVLASSDVCKDSASPPLSQQDAIVQPYVDGTAFGSPFTVTASRANSNATQEFDISLASVSAASHTIGFKLTNDYFPSCDRNGWIATVKLNGTTYSATSDSTNGTQATVNANGWGPTGWYPLFDNADVANFDSVSVTHPSAPPAPAAPPCPTGLPVDTACVMLNEDITGTTQNAIAQLFADGTAVGSPITVTANHATAWQEADVSFAGLTAANHAIQVEFMNAATSPAVRNLYVKNFTLNGTVYTPSADSTNGTTTSQLTATGQYTKYDSVPVTHPIVPPAHTLKVAMGQYCSLANCINATFQVDGTTVTASPSFVLTPLASAVPANVEPANSGGAPWACSGIPQTFSFSTADLSTGSHTLTVTLPTGATAHANLCVHSTQVDNNPVQAITGAVAPSNNSSTAGTARFSADGAYTIGFSALPAGSPQQMDSTHKNSNITLSTTTTTNDTATDTSGANDYAAFGKIGATTTQPQKIYWEVTGTALYGGAQVGIGLTTSPTAAASWLGATTDEMGYSPSGQVMAGNWPTPLTTIATYTAASTLRFALDTGACKLWIAVGAGNWDNNGTHNPATNTGGIAVPTAICSSGKTIVPGMSIGSDTGNMVFHFASNTWGFTVPSGFGPWSGGPAPLPESLTVNAPPYHGVAQTITGSIANLSSAPSSLDMVVNGMTTPATCGTLTATGFSCTFTPTAAGSYGIQFKDHTTGAISPLVNETVN